MNVLLIEDEPQVAGLISRGLAENNYQVTVAPDGEIGLEMAKNNPFDVIVLDIMLPVINGMQLCRLLRSANINTPILFLTALGTTENIVAGLDAGADDYLVKPFKFAELEARIKSVSRRRQSAPQNAEVKLQASELVMDLQSKQVTVSDNQVVLTSTEFRLLEFLMRNKNKVLSRMEILEKVWGVEFNMATNVVDVYITYLRKKLAKVSERKFIQTVVGMGYMLKTEG